MHKHVPFHAYSFSKSFNNSKRFPKISSTIDFVNLSHKRPNPFAADHLTIYSLSDKLFIKKSIIVSRYSKLIS